jgi:hypothetical protein
MTDLLTLPRDQSDLLNWMMRTGRVDLAQIAAHLEQEPEETLTDLTGLIDLGFVQVFNTKTDPHYEVRLVATRPRHLPQVLAEAAAAVPLATSAAAAAGQTFRQQPAWLERALNVLLGEWGRFWLGLTPLIIVFLAAQWQLFTGSESFAEPLSFIGVVVIALLAGIFPVLLLRSSRRRGDTVPTVVYHFIGHPIFLVIIFLLSLTGVILHGLFIWDDPLLRGLALAAAAVIIGMTFNAWRGGAFIPRFIAELRGGPSGNDMAKLALIYSGQPVETEMRLTFAGNDTSEQQIKAASHNIANLKTLQSATIQLPATRANEIKVLAQQITPEGNALALPVTTELNTGSSTQQVSLRETGGQAVLTLEAQAGWLTLTLRKKTS